MKFKNTSFILWIMFYWFKIIQYEDYHKAEKRWHKILKQFNHNREWFNISEDIVEKIVQCNDWCFITVN